MQGAKSNVTRVRGEAVWGRAWQRMMQGRTVLARTLATWLDRAQKRRQLARFSERELKDIGAPISDVVIEINKPFWRP